MVGRGWCTHQIVCSVRYPRLSHSGHPFPEEHEANPNMSLHRNKLQDILIYTGYMMIWMIPAQVLKWYFIWSMILNSYVVQPIKRRKWYYSLLWQQRLEIYVMYLSLGHSYKLRSLYDSICIYSMCKWSHWYPYEYVCAPIRIMHIIELPIKQL